MSAFDVAGALVWTPMAVLFWMATFNRSKERDMEAALVGFFVALMLTFVSVFSIARLLGAHL